MFGCLAAGEAATESEVNSSFGAEMKHDSLLALFETNEAVKVHIKQICPIQWYFNEPCREKTIYHYVTEPIEYIFSIFEKKIKKDSFCNGLRFFLRKHI